MPVKNKAYHFFHDLANPTGYFLCYCISKGGFRQSVLREFNICLIIMPARANNAVGKNAAGISPPTHSGSHAGQSMTSPRCKAEDRRMAASSSIEIPAAAPLSREESRCFMVSPYSQSAGALTFSLPAGILWAVRRRYPL